jgi:peptidoglycan/LPS O-acetylase OafA/YrhL
VNYHRLTPVAYRDNPAKIRRDYFTASIHHSTVVVLCGKIKRRDPMSTETVLLLVVIALVVLALPAWPHSKEWGYRPTGVLMVLLVVFLVWAIAGGRPLFRRTVGQDIRATGHDVGDSVRRAFK